jgi:electron-transferring-flavoprotein dehydrogenase
MTSYDIAGGRESMQFDVVIVGAGPAGLAAAIRLKQLDPSVSVVVIEKASRVGDHILSGAVVDPVGIDALLPGWRDEADHPFRVRVAEDRFVLLGRRIAIPIPSFLMPPMMHNHGNFVVSLGEVCRWLAGKAEGLGVEIYPGFAGTELLYDADGSVAGVATGDMGIARDGSYKSGYTRGMALLGRYVLLGEGARGSLAKQAIARFGLDSECDPAKFGLGLKELWQVDPARHRPGLIQHTMGWPLDAGTGGGSFLYHLDNHTVAVGFVVHLDYANPNLSPFAELQRFKTHPAIRTTFEGGKRLAYGARTISEGGWQSVPRLVFPGGALLGCAAGLLNVPRIKGSHNAILSGIAAAEAAITAISQGRGQDELTAYEDGWRNGPIGRDLFPVRNVKPLWSRFGTLVGVVLGGIDMWITRLTGGISVFGTLHHRNRDRDSLRPAAESRPIGYPKPDGTLTFDRLSSVYLSGTSHDEDQPSHLRVGDLDLAMHSELGLYGGPSNRYCPAGVYEWLDQGGTLRLQVNAANCVHCKACDIKDPDGNITWTPPQGGEGPAYGSM